MARFCSNCGRSLQEGEVCNCRQVNLGTGQATGQTNGQANGQQNTYISYVTGAGFLLTGICGIIEERKSRK